ncbi:Peflin [Lamellibrachia satsuma]|nr:Peflin [Lamellibrachia satsuma]
MWAGQPPQQAQGQGAYPPVGYQQQFHGAPPPPGVNPELWSRFQTVDNDHNGQISVDELQQALVYGNWSPFNPETCRLMIGMFDRNNSGTIDINEFAALWKYIEAWKACFDRFDTDRSGNIDAGELHQAFVSFGYNISQTFVNLCLSVFDRKNEGSMNFDDFIQCCVMVKTLTDQFRGKDVQQRGIVQLRYEEFLMMALDNKVV